MYMYKKVDGVTRGYCKEAFTILYYYSITFEAPCIPAALLLDTLHINLYIAWRSVTKFVTHGLAAWPSGLEYPLLSVCNPLDHRATARSRTALVHLYCRVPAGPRSLQYFKSTHAWTDPTYKTLWQCAAAKLILAAGPGLWRYIPLHSTFSVIS